MRTQDVIPDRTKLAGMALAGIAWAGLAFAVDPAADWKLYAFTATKKQAALFYLDSELVRTPLGHVQVWMKGLDYMKLDKASNALHEKDEVFKNTVRRVGNKYVPPFAGVTKLSADQMMSIVMFEQLADEASISPTMRVLFEFDCPQKLFRTLSVIGPQPARNGNAVGDWEHVPPESTIDTLSKLTCP
jgi:hypothetical protein